ncbi:hypothetical protein TNCT_585731 [Trichonephila clavata]|uniref:F-box only protein 22 n=1 Tax=Trichonephila clavata TaxID=2740835 RepID=A0A8X6LU55_TRICU|nr:hypothetical protein TNCT_585731 [Trichonephila clavata]
MDRERIIFTSHHLVQIIFKHLDARSLNSCAQVCTLWSRIAVAEKESRRNIFSIVKVGACHNTEIRRQIELCPIIDHSVMEGELFQELKNIPIEPIFCVAFMSVPLFAKFQEFFPSFGSSKPETKRVKFCEETTKRKYLHGIVQTAFKNFLPDKCEVSFTVAAGIIGCDADCVPMEIENGPAMSGIFIPKVEGVTINKCCLNKRNFSTTEFIAQNAPLKALLVFSTSKGVRCVNNLIHSYRSDDGSIKMAVGGAIVERTDCCVGSVVAFSGPNVEAASIIININDKKEEITAKLETFKETGLLNHKCFAFMFACIGRGYSFHQEHNVESSIFCKMYPNIPLIGLFGNGEVGYNYLPNFPIEKTLRAGSFARYERKFLHGYTSVFVLISLKM